MNSRVGVIPSGGAGTSPAGQDETHPKPNRNQCSNGKEKVALRGPDLTLPRARRSTLRTVEQAVASTRDQAANWLDNFPREW